MASLPGLRRRGGSWEIRKRVPQRLQPEIGLREIVKSFGAVSQADAHRAAWLELGAIEKRFEAAEIVLGIRSKPIALASFGRAFTPNQLTEHARAYLRELETHRKELPIDPEDRETAADNIRMEVNAVASPHAVEDAGLQRVANLFAERAGILLPADPFPFYRAIQQAELEFLGRQHARLNGEAEPSINQAFAGVRAEMGPSSLTLSNAIARYKERPNRRDLAKKTHVAVAFRLRDLEELIGPDRKVRSITREDLRCYVEQLERMPAHAAQVSSEQRGRAGGRI